MTITALNTLSSTNQKYAVNSSTNSGVNNSGFTPDVQMAYHKRDGYKDSNFRRTVGRHPPLAFTGKHTICSNIRMCDYRVKPVAVSPFWIAGSDSFNVLDNITLTDARVVTASEISALRYSAVVNANSQVKGQHYSAFETLYEGRKTVSMITNTVATIVKGLRQVKKGKFSAAATTLGLKRPPKDVHRKRSLANNWLEYRYGWIPLYSTVYGEMKRQYDLQKAKTPEYTVTGFSSNHFTGSTTQNYGPSVTNSFGQQVYAQRRVVSTGFHVYLCEVSYTYRLTNETLANTTSLGILNPALLAWEAVPFSFVADWFVNVSDVLETFDTWNGKQFLHGYRTDYDKYTEKRTVDLKAVSGYTLVTMVPGSAFRTTHSVSRVVLSEPVGISLKLNHNPLNITRLADGISLLKQLVK